MALTNFVPEIWSQELNITLRKALVGLSLVNTDYEGEIMEKGDTVRINRPSAVATGAYSPGTDITIETPVSTQLTLLIDQAQYFAFEIDDVRKVQANVDLIGPYTEEGIFKNADDLDQFILGQYTGAAAANVITKQALSSTNVLDALIQAKKLLSKQSVPKSGRWIVLDPDEVAFLEGNDKFTHATQGGDDVIRNGFVGRAAGFDVFESNNTVTVNDGTDDVRHLPFGHRIAITFAFQAAQLEGARMEKRFSDLIKGLWLYGAQVIKAEALGDLRAIV